MPLSPRKKVNRFFCLAQNFSFAPFRSRYGDGDATPTVHRNIQLLDLSGDQR